MSAPGINPATVPRRAWKSWNTKLHLYLGLYFLVFLWLFAVSGLLLNHAWRFAEFWPQRQQTSRAQRVTLAQGGGDLARAQDLMRQLDLAGEVEWTATRPTLQRFEFRVQRPGRTVEVRVDTEQQSATIQEIRVNGWGFFRSLHTFTGTRAHAPTAERDWWLTQLWSFAMDALAGGLLLLVATSVVLARERRDQWLGSAAALGAGVAVCAFFVFGLRWL
ncbi:MAG: putative PepSY TM-like [Verrucomicrobiota bacterium]|jgi:hypothetical protein